MRTKTHNMFSLFTKKEKLRNYLEGFVDIHNHVLPGIDDGASTVEDSLDLIRRYQELGILEIIATPHVMNDYYANTPRTIDDAYQKLSLEAANEFPQVKIRRAAEYMMDHSFLELMEKGKLLCLKENFVLVEMSYFQAPINLNEILFQLQTQKYKPVLAHPERYVYFHSPSLERYQLLKKHGCLFQMNILSLIGHYGRQIQQVLFELLDAKMIDFAGTDTHQIRHLEKLLDSTIPAKRISQLKPILERTVSTFRISS